MHHSNPKNTAGFALAVTVLALAHVFAFGQNSAPMILAKFTGNVNSKSAKVGDSVTAVTKRASKLKDGQGIPKGSKLRGKVVAVESKQAGNGISLLAIDFDQIELKDRSVLAVRGQIAAIGMTYQWQGDLTQDSVMNRGASIPALTVDPHPGPGSGEYENLDTEYPKAGSTIKGVNLDLRPGKDSGTQLRGIKQDIQISSEVLINVRLD